jgi:glycosyltransferase involved in cell wall biosynthesis
VKMRLIHVLWNGEAGGAQRAVYVLAREQHRRGCSVAIGFGHAAGPFIEKARQAGLPIVDFGLRSGRDIAALPRAIRLLSMYEVHHFHSAEPVLMLASVACRQANRLYTHRGGLIAYEGRRAWRYRLLSGVIRRSYTVTGTAQAARAVERLFGIPQARVLQTANAVDSDVVTTASRRKIRRALGLDSDAVLIGTAANLRRLKRVDWLLSAAERLPPSNWQIVIVGDGEDRRRLESRAASSWTSSRILFAGMRQDVDRWLAALDVFVLPSGPEESFGNAVVEAMANALPVVVCADCSAHLEHVQNGATGFVVADADELVECLKILLRRPQLRSSVGKAAAAAVRRRYTVESMLERFEAAYLHARITAEKEYVLTEPISPPQKLAEPVAGGHRGAGAPSHDSNIPQPDSLRTPRCAE